MIRELEIKNYRCFKRLHLSDLGRINILVGDSGSGKSAFLEALFLAGGINPEIYLRIRQFRGFPASSSEIADRDNYESLWRDLFFDLQQNEPAHIQFDDNRSGRRWLNISYAGSQTITVPIDDKSPVLGIPTPISFEWFGNDRTFRTEVAVKKDGLQMESFDVGYSIVYVFPAAFSAKENAKRFSYLSKRNEAKPLIEAVRKLFPMVNDISIETNWGQPALYASVESLHEKLPVSVLSGGINKYLGILLSICVSDNGVVLVDEFEEGFYYKNFKAIADSLIDACSDHHVQLFASTHSYEFLEAITPITEEREEGFRLLRFSRDEDGVSDVRAIRGKHYKSAIERDFEIR